MRMGMARPRCSGLWLLPLLPFLAMARRRLRFRGMAARILTPSRRCSSPWPLSPRGSRLRLTHPGRASMGTHRPTSRRQYRNGLPMRSSRLLARSRPFPHRLPTVPSSLRRMSARTVCPPRSRRSFPYRPSRVPPPRRGTRVRRVRDRTRRPQSPPHPPPLRSPSARSVRSTRAHIPSLQPLPRPSSTTPAPTRTLQPPRDPSRSPHPPTSPPSHRRRPLPRPPPSPSTTSAPDPLLTTPSPPPSRSPTRMSSTIWSRTPCWTGRGTG